MAEEFTGTKFLQWKVQNQEAFIGESIAMMIILSGDTQNGKNWSQCVSDWFYGDQRESLEFVKANIARFEDFQPQLTIYASARKKCGSF